MYTIKETPFMRRYRHPVNRLQKGEGDGWGITAEDNPACGDDILLYLDIRDGVIQDGKYAGDACAVCTVSADLMLDAVRGKTLSGAKECACAFRQFMQENAEVHSHQAEILGDAKIMQEVRGLPSRRACALLPWKALERAARKEEEKGNAGR